MSKIQQAKQISPAASCFYSSLFPNSSVFFVCPISFLFLSLVSLSFFLCPPSPLLSLSPLFVRIFFLFLFRARDASFTTSRSLNPGLHACMQARVERAASSEWRISSPKEEKKENSNKEGGEGEKRRRRTKKERERNQREKEKWNWTHKENRGIGEKRRIEAASSRRDLFGLLNFWHLLFGALSPSYAYPLGWQ